MHLGPKPHSSQYTKTQTILTYLYQHKHKRFTYQHQPIPMAHGKMNMGLVLVVIAMLCAGATAQSSCTNVLVSLSPCLNYITGNSSTPSSGCCSQLATVVRSQPQCLCQVLGGGASSLGININQTQALAMPGACKVQTPPLSQCNTAATPASSPEEPAAESPNSGPSGTGSKSTPTTGDGSSSGNSIKLSIPLLLVLAAATMASTLRTY